MVNNVINELWRATQLYRDSMKYWWDPCARSFTSYCIVGIEVSDFRCGTSKKSDFVILLPTQWSGMVCSSRSNGFYHATLPCLILTVQYSTKSTFTISSIVKTKIDVLPQRISSLKILFFHFFAAVWSLCFSDTDPQSIQMFVPFSFCVQWDSLNTPKCNVWWAIIFKVFRDPVIWKILNQ